MLRRIIWHEAAWEQLSNAYAYIKKNSPQNAEKVKDGILKKVDQLAFNPEMHPPDKYKRKNNSSQYRAFIIYHFRISYYVKSDEIIIVRMRHTSMSPLAY